MPSMSSPNEHSKARRVALTGLLAALFLGARWLIRLVPEKGGQYLVISVADIRTLTLCVVCLLAGFLLGILASGIVRFLNR